MNFSKADRTNSGSPGGLARLVVFVLLLLGAATVQAENCSDYPDNTLDGAAGTPAPENLNIDGNCTIRNYRLPDNPFETNISFFTSPGTNTERWLVVFDNVDHTKNISCNATLGHILWFTNGSSTAIKDGCQNLLIPVEKIDKQNPPGETTATVGVPFTYRLTVPVLYSPRTDTVINTEGSPNDIHSIVLTDDLNATGVDLSYVRHEVYWEASGAPVPHGFTNAGGVLTFQGLPVVPAGEQIIIELTVVLEDTPANTPGTTFFNTAKWQFGRLIEGTFYEPLPGEWGISEPLTIAGPDLAVTKTGPATMNLGVPGDFRLDVQNTGNRTAWDVTLLDRLPDGPTGGMCDAAPELLSAQVFASDGATPVSGKGPLEPGLDFIADFSAAPACELRLTLLSAAASIAPGERLVVVYRSELDPDTVTGAALTNVAGAVEWFNADDSEPGRQAYIRTLTNGTVGTLDFQDAHTVNSLLTGLFFEKTVANLTTGVDPTTTAGPGDRLRYSLRLRTTDAPLNDFRLLDDMGALNTEAVFQPGSLSLVAGTVPAGADVSNTSPSGGTNSAGLLDIRGLSLPADSEVTIQFDITLAGGLIDGTVVTNQAEMISADGGADSDDPYVNGLADPFIDGDEDPTRVLIEGEPPTALDKANTQDTAAIGESFRYRITVPATPHVMPLYDVQILDDLAASAADLEFVDVTRVSGSGAWTPVNTGTLTSLVIEDPVNGIDIPAGEQAVIEITVRLLDTSTNVAGLEFINTAAYRYNLREGDDLTSRPGEGDSTAPMTVVEPEITLEKRGPPLMRIGAPATFTLDLHNTGESPAWNITVVDVLPDTAAGGMCSVPPDEIVVRRYAADGVTPLADALTPGTDYTATFDPAPACTLSLEMLSAAAALNPSERLLVTYRAALDADTSEDAVLTNIAAATSWSSAGAAAADDPVRDYARTLTDGTVGVLDHEDAHTVNLGELLFEKTVANVTTGADPAATATPGDTLRYTLRVENLSDVELTGFAFRDELDRLNATPAFAAGTLTVVDAPAGADTSATDASGGASGTGVLSVANLTLAPSGGSVTVVFEVDLAPVIANGTVVLNQAGLESDGVVLALSDDPGVNGPADPGVPGDEDPTQVTITSAPAFVVEKTSTDLTGDPDVLLAGETLRYTLTIRNTGTDDATDATLRDLTPANTAYVAGSTTLNGSPVDDVDGRSALVDGMPVNAAGESEPGSIPADPEGLAENVATVTFDVVVDPDVADGTIIANQGFASAVNGGVSDQPSDDPATPAEDDPTRDIVGNFPLLYADKRVELQVDGTSPGIVDPGDVLRYTITVQNSAATAATGVTLTDALPENTSYVADSTTVNGLPVARPDGGVFPLAAGIDISSSDLTPPLPGAGEGTITGGESAVIQFDLRVNDDVPSGTVISNQATVASETVSSLLTDGDGNPATGPEPTVVIVGDAQLLSVSKQVAVVGGGPALAGAELEYLLRVTNVASVPALAVVITDDLDAATPGALTYVAGSALLNGAAAGVAATGNVLVADYAASLGPLAPGDDAVLRFRARISEDLPIGTTVTNTGVVTWNTPSQSAEASVSIDVGGTPGVGVLGGALWHDADFDNVQGTAERVLEGWTVEVYRNGDPLTTTISDTEGRWRVSGLVPNDVGTDTYEVRFRAPWAGSRTALLGSADSPFTNSLQRIADVVVASGENLTDLNLPIDPNGVVYDSVVRTPVAGATLTLLDAGSGTALPATCFDDPAQQGQLTGPDGYYKFDLSFADPACPSGGAYLLGVDVPGGGDYLAGYSAVIPPASDATTAPLSVPVCPGTADDAVPVTTDYCEAQVSEFAPPTGVPARTDGTTYHVHLRLDDSRAPGSSQLFNNHIPVDQELEGALAITKTTPSVNVSRGQLVPYTITVSNTLPINLPDLAVVDRFPAGFRYVEGSARLDGTPLEPEINGLELTWNGLEVAGSGQRTLKLLLAVGAGVTEGEYVNRAQAVNGFTGSAFSGEATATVRVVPDPTFDCTDVTGKVFDDRNRNGFQDSGESGLQGVRVVTTRGLAATTDAHGRFHITCAATPREGRGSNFSLKLDDRTLPSGYRMSNEAVQIKRATRGKALKFNFGASIHRVVGLDVADPVFEPGTVEMRRQWKPRINLLMEELLKAPATLRLSYLADVEDADLVERRLDAMKTLILDAWQQHQQPYRLTVEPEVFWRLGGPVERPELPQEASR